MTLVFLCLSNIVLYLEKAQDKSLKGIFYELKITTVLLTFAILNLIGTAPGIGLLDKFYLINILLKEDLPFANAIFIVNLVTLISFSGRLFYLFFSKSDGKRSEEDIFWAKNIDFDSSLILTALVTAVAIFLSLILFPLLTNFFSI
jgi:formate hydrogenlyase subunit 3/multisubunit Na+/H+ antiporter MnhD subunit